MRNGTAVGCWLSAAGCRLSAIGYRLAAIRWLLARFGAFGAMYNKCAQGATTTLGLKGRQT